MQRPALAWALALLTGACVSLEPAYKRPAAPVPAAFPQGGAYGQIAPMQTAAADLPWREVFLDPRLQQVIDAALTNNRDLRATAATVAQARATYRAQRAAQLPHIDGTASATLSGTSDGRGGTDQSESYSADLGLSAFEIDLFGRQRSLSKAALEQYFASDYGARATRISLIAETAQAWLTLAADQDLLRIARDTQAVADQSVQLNRQRMEGGVGSQLEVSQADTVLQQARADAAAYATQVAQDRNALELLVGGPLSEGLLPQTLEEGAVLADLPVGLSSEVLLRRPDIMQSESLLLSANANIGAARAAFFPRISLTGATGFASSALSSLFQDGSFVYSAAPSITLNIFDGGENRANLALRRAQRDEAVANYEGAIQTAFREVADALARRGTMTEQLEATRRLAASARTGAEVSQSRFSAGADTYLNALDAQRTWYSAQQSLVSVELTRAVNRVTLYRALGGGQR